MFESLSLDNDGDGGDGDDAAPLAWAEGGVSTFSEATQMTHTIFWLLPW